MIVTPEGATVESEPRMTDHPEAVVYFLFQLLLTLWMLVSTCFLWATIRTTKHLHTPLNRYVASLVLVNYLQACTVMPLSIINDAVVWVWKYGEFFCQFWQAMDSLCRGMSAWCICVIMIDRILYHFKRDWYQRKGSKGGKYMLAALWIGGASVSLLLYFTAGSSSLQESSDPNVYQCHIRYDKQGFVAYNLIMSYLTPLIFAMVSYALLVYKVRKELLFEVRPVSQSTRIHPLDIETLSRYDTALSLNRHLQLEDHTSFSLRLGSNTPGFDDTPRSNLSFSSPYGHLGPSCGKSSSMSLMSNTSVDLPAHLGRKVSLASNHSIQSLSDKIWHKAGIIVAAVGDASNEDLVRQLPPEEAPRFTLPKVKIPTFKYMRPNPVLYREPGAKGKVVSLPNLPLIKEADEEMNDALGRKVINVKSVGDLGDEVTPDDQPPSRDSGIDSPNTAYKDEMAQLGAAGFKDHYGKELGNGSSPQDTKTNCTVRVTPYQDQGINPAPSNADDRRRSNEDNPYDNIDYSAWESRQPGVTPNTDDQLCRPSGPPRLTTSIDMGVPDNMNNDVTHTDYNIIKKLGLVIFPYFILWFPFYITIGVLSSCESCNIYYLTYSFLIYVGYANSAVNPLLYLLCFPDFRAALRKVLRCQNPNFQKQAESTDDQGNAPGQRKNTVKYATSFEETELSVVARGDSQAELVQNMEHDLEVSEV